MKAATGYKPKSNIITSMSVKQKNQSDYFQMREECAKYGFSQNDVQMIIEHISKNCLSVPRRFRKNKIFRYGPETENLAK